MNTNHLSSTPSIAERTAAASVVSVIAGLVLPTAAFHSLGRATLAWFIFCLLVGLLLGTKTQVSIKKAVTLALLPSALIPLTYSMFWLVRFLGDWAKHGEMPDVGIGLSATPLNITSPIVLTVSLAILVILFLATLLVVSLTSVGKRPLVLSIVKAYKLGPDGFDRVQKIVIAIGGIAAALSALWLAVGANAA